MGVAINSPGTGILLELSEMHFHQFFQLMAIVDFAEFATEYVVPTCKVRVVLDHVSPRFVGTGMEMSACEQRQVSPPSVWSTQRVGRWRQYEWPIVYRCYACEPIRERAHFRNRVAR